MGVFYHPFKEKGNQAKTFLLNDTDDTNWYFYYVPVSMESDFDAAIAAYKAAHAE